MAFLKYDALLPSTLLCALPHVYLSQLGLAKSLNESLKLDTFTSIHLSNQVCLKSCYLQHKLVQLFAAPHPLPGFMYVEVEDAERIDFMLFVHIVVHKQLTMANFEDSDDNAFTTENQSTPNKPLINHIHCIKRNSIQSHVIQSLL